jgi:hypothetical protein
MKALDSNRMYSVFLNLITIVRKMRVLLESNQFLSDISLEICSNDDWKSVVGS